VLFKPQLADASVRLERVNQLHTALCCSRAGLRASVDLAERSNHGGALAQRVLGTKSSALGCATLAGLSADGQSTDRHPCFKFGLSFDNGTCRVSSVLRHHVGTETHAAQCVVHAVTHTTVFRTVCQNQVTTVDGVAGREVARSRCDLAWSNSSCSICQCRTSSTRPAHAQGQTIECGCSIGNRLNVDVRAIDIVDVLVQRDGATCVTQTAGQVGVHRTHGECTETTRQSQSEVTTSSVLTTVSQINTANGSHLQAAAQIFNSCEVDVTIGTSCTFGAARILPTKAHSAADGHGRLSERSGGGQGSQSS